jgi:hypothetical protein
MRLLLIFTGILWLTFVPLLSYADCDSSYNYCKSSCDRYYDQCIEKKNTVKYCSEQYAGNSQCLQGCSNALDACNSKNMKP